MLVDDDSRVQANRLNSSLYVSDDEMWFAGTSYDGKPWLCCANRAGEVLYVKELKDVPANRVYVGCISKVDETLMLGIIDHETQFGFVGLLEIGHQDRVIYHSIENTKISKMVPAEQGMLILGEDHDVHNLTARLAYFLIDHCGKTIFQGKGELREQNSTLSDPLCCSAGDRYYILEYIGVKSCLLPDAVLTCLDGEGREQWRVPLAKNMSVISLAADEDHVYLLGWEGEVTAEGIIQNRKAMVRCYTSNGVERWLRVFDTPAMYRHGYARDSICVGANTTDDQWFFCALDANGAVLNIYIREVASQYINSVVLDTAGNLMILGMSEENLIIVNTSH